MEDISERECPLSRENPFENASRNIFIEDLRKALSNAISSLSYREREIIKLRYGLVDGQSYTLKEIGNIFNRDRERIRQIESKALCKLKWKLRKSLKVFNDY
ncbi:MAG: sigma-70 family RNA polymerase sigma factor [Nanoarchaeota archaeon]